MGMYNSQYRDRVYRVSEVDTSYSRITTHKIPAVDTTNSKREVASAQERGAPKVDPHFSKRVAEPAKTVNPHHSAITGKGGTIDTFV